MGLSAHFGATDSVVSLLISSDHWGLQAQARWARCAEELVIPGSCPQTRERPHPLTTSLPSTWMLRESSASHSKTCCLRGGGREDSGDLLCGSASHPMAERCRGPSLRGLSCMKALAFWKRLPSKASSVVGKSGAIIKDRFQAPNDFPVPEKHTQANVGLRRAAPTCAFKVWTPGKASRLWGVSTLCPEQGSCCPDGCALRGELGPSGDAAVPRESLSPGCVPFPCACLAHVRKVEAAESNFRSSADQMSQGHLRRSSQKPKKQRSLAWER